MIFHAYSFNGDVALGRGINYNLQVSNGTNFNSPVEFQAGVVYQKNFFLLANQSISREK